MSVFSNLIILIRLAMILFCVLLFQVERASSQEKATPKIDFSYQVKPILSDNCFSCHGPDEKNRATDFRLDQKKSALAKAHSVIVPSDVDSSLLVQRIFSKDADEVMPPSGHRKKLSDAEKQVLVKWIEQGADWSEHWAFEHPNKTETPTLKYSLTKPEWPKNYIDFYILKRLELEAVKPSPVAKPNTLLRRLNFDLTGLPPSATDVAEFNRLTKSEGFDAAYHQQVKRLLASPHFGERMAVYWLDLVRYADTVGYHGDQNVSVSPYRDYVIDAFNENKPFDQFTREQLAGDLIRNPTLQQRVASGYNRLGMMSAEGGVQPEEYLNKYASDRVRTTSAVWLGVTLGCAECHDHKFDPLTSREFYEFSAFFADVKEKGLYAGSNNTGKWGESIEVASKKLPALLNSYDENLLKLKAQMVETEAVKQERIAWEDSVRKNSTSWKTMHPRNATAIKAKLEVKEDFSILASGKNDNKECYLVVVDVEPGVTGFRLEALPDDKLPLKGPGRASNGNFVVTELIGLEGDRSRDLDRVSGLISDWPDALKSKTIKFKNATASFEQTYAASHPDKKWSARSAIDMDSRGRTWGWAVMPESNKANELVVQIGDSSQAPSTMTFVIQQDHGNGSHTLGRFRLSQTTAANPTASPPDLPAELRRIIHLRPDDRSPKESAVISQHYLTIAPQYEALRRQISQVSKEREEAIRENTRTSLVTVAVKPREIRVLKRGNWMDKTGDVVLPGVPSVLGGKNWEPAELKNGRATRMELANWITDKSNPLTARVFVNRVWRMFFGSGLSDVLDDLGAQGEPPTHPELLDRLAIEFVESGWNVKQLIRTMVLSQTYRQSSAIRKDLRVTDPENRLLARQSRFRLDAEFIRDHALSVAGLLSRDIGGKSVMPYQPVGFYRHLNFPTRKYKPSQGTNQYRRGLYTHWQRQFLHPAMRTFDAPSREECTAARPRSSTPLAALVMLNDPSYVEAARGLANLAMMNADSNDERIQWIFQRTLSRPANVNEVEIINALYTSHHLHFTENADEANKLLSVGSADQLQSQTKGSNREPAEIAAWVSVCRAVMNMHEFILRK